MVEGRDVDREQPSHPVHRSGQSSVSDSTSAPASSQRPDTLTHEVIHFLVCERGESRTEALVDSNTPPLSFTSP